MPKIFKTFLVLISITVIGCGGGGGGGNNESSSDNSQPSAPLSSNYLIGAHYYLWFPQNFRAGYLRGDLSPPQEPMLGEYSSGNSAAVEEQIRWAKEFGVSFFTLDWWPTRPTQNAVIDSSFLKAKNISDTKFCIFYETIDLGFRQDKVATIFTPAIKTKFLADMHELTRYFNHPSYLKVNGRPVVIFYVTRTLAGDYKSAFKQAKEDWKNSGFDPYLIGDEIYWNVTTPGSSDDDPVLTEEPQRDRIALFDAITAYNLYAPGFQSHAGYASQSAHFSDAAALYQKYDAARGDTAIVPGVIPGYNDRGHRLQENHYVIPRQFSPGEPEGSLLKEYFKRIGYTYADPGLNMILVTSWNEWNEDTAIEPLADANATTKDRSQSGNAFTQGFSYSGFGTTYLEVIQAAARGDL